MARNFKDFGGFPGAFTPDNRYTFPVLHHTGGRNRHRTWTISIRLIKRGTRMEKHSYGWDLLQEDEIPISPVYFEEELPPGTIAEMWAEVSIIDGKTTRGVYGRVVPFSVHCAYAPTKFSQTYKRGQIK